MIDIGKINLSEITQKELKYVTVTEDYHTIGEFLEDAIRTFLMARKDIRIEIACNMYKNREISIGKACELAGVNIEQMKEELHRRKMQRFSTEKSAELQKMAKTLGQDKE